LEKRRKEQMRRQKLQNKEERRAQRESQKVTRPKPTPGQDPDLAGIVPGPQPGQILPGSEEELPPKPGPGSAS
jgi:hypothetical protein